MTLRETKVELGSGRFVTIEAGPRQARHGFDGSLVWRQGRGLIALQPDQNEAATGVYMKARGYLFPGRFPADVRLLGTRTVEGRLVDAFAITPPGGSTVELFLDSSTRRPFAERYGTALFVYEDYRETGGLWLARRSRAGAGTAPFTATTEEVELDPKLDPAAFEIPGPPRRFGAGASAAAVGANGSIVRAAVDGKGPFPFMVDTGGFGQLSPALVRRLGLDVAPNAPVSVHVAFGDLSIASFTFLNSLGLGNVARTVFEGHDEAGVLGVETFLNFVVAFEPGRVVFHSTAAFEPPPEAAVHPISLEGGRPVVEGRIEGRPARFVLDTGSNAELVLFPAFVEEAGLLERLAGGERVKAIYGFQTLSGARATLKDLKAGPIEEREAMALLVDGRVLGAPTVSGLVGMGILRRRYVAFDYRRRRIYVR